MTDPRKNWRSRPGDALSVGPRGYFHTPTEALAHAEEHSIDRLYVIETFLGRSTSEPHCKTCQCQRYTYVRGWTIMAGILNGEEVMTQSA